MKSTEQFKNTIKTYLDNLAADDELFAASYAKQHKSLDECINYIFNEVYKSGCNGFDDAEIYGMAVHYYEEDSIKGIMPTDGQVVVNHHIELTEEEKAEARKKAKTRFEQDCLREMHSRNKKVAEAQRKAAEAAKKEKKEPVQLSLFD